MASGAFAGDKADAVFKKVRLECKRTDKPGITFDLAWVNKIERDIRADEFFAFEIEIQDKRIYLISEGEFRFLKWALTTPVPEIISALKDGTYKNV